MKIPFTNRWTGKVIFEAEIPDDTEDRFRLKIGLEIAVKSGANLRGANLDCANLRGANLDGANLDGAYLRGAYLDGANLRGENLRGANLDCANLRGANLRGANLDGAYLRGAYLDGANLRGENLRGANLDCANLRGANLRGANLDGANLGEKTGKLVGERPVLQIGPIGSRNDWMQAFNCENGVFVRAGCFFDNLGLFEVAVEETHGDSEHGRMYRAAIALVKATWPVVTEAVDAAE